MTFVHRARRPEIAMELTPLIDVVFLLLIFFMVTTTFAVTAGIDVKLPTSTSKRLDKRVDKVDLSLTRDGGLYWDSTRIPWAELRPRLETLRTDNPKALIAVHPDVRWMNDHVFKIMDTAREVGFRRIGLAARFPEGVPED